MSSLSIELILVSHLCFDIESRTQAETFMEKHILEKISSCGKFPIITADVVNEQQWSRESVHVFLRCQQLLLEAFLDYAHWISLSGESHCWIDIA